MPSGDIDLHCIFLVDSLRISHSFIETAFKDHESVALVAVNRYYVLPDDAGDQRENHADMGAGHIHELVFYYLPDGGYQRHRAGRN